MKYIKNIFLIGVILPILIAFLNYNYSSISFFEWAHDRINEISIVSLFVSSVACIVIMFINYKLSINSKFWYFFSTLLVILFLLYAYTIHSLSTFGF